MDLVLNLDLVQNVTSSSSTLTVDHEPRTRACGSTWHWFILVQTTGLIRYRLHGDGYVLTCGRDSSFSVGHRTETFTEDRVGGVGQRTGCCVTEVVEPWNTEHVMSTRNVNRRTNRCWIQFYLSWVCCLSPKGHVTVGPIADHGSVGPGPGAEAPDQHQVYEDSSVQRKNT